MNIKGLTHTEPYEPITVEDYHEIHLALWNWLIENPLEAKNKWPGWELVLYHSSVCCSACDFASFQSRKNPAYMCDHCPIKVWRRPMDEGGRCYNRHSIFGEWGDSREVACRREAATIIRDLEWIRTKEIEND